MPNAEMTLEGVTSKLTYFQLQLQLCHWQTTSYAEHKATDKLHSFVLNFKDEVLEKLMGYIDRRVKAYTLAPITITSPVNVVNELIAFAYALETWASANQYCDIESLSQSLSGEAAKTKYLLTLK